MSDAHESAHTRRTSRRAVSARGIAAIVLVFAAVGLIAWWRVGLLDLPRVPKTLTAEQVGLAGLDALQLLDQYVRATPDVSELLSSQTPTHVSHQAWRVRTGVNYLASGEIELGLATMREGVSAEYGNLVLGNAYRIEVFRLRRTYLKNAHARGELVPQFPPHLDRQPIAFFEQLVREHPSREAKLQLALAWVDEMLLFPALEIKAPASVQAVDILGDVLQGADAYYVPALFARGLNHLHRPARLVWPETEKTPKDAAVQDIGRCVAIGGRIGTGSARLHALMAMTLGDAYVKAGRYDQARSWWQIAQNLSADEDVQAGVRRRYGWRDEEIIDRLEEELDRARAELDRPMTDLAMMWE